MNVSTRSAPARPTPPTSHWGGQRARDAQAQVLRGEWIFYWSPVIDQLKREGRLQEAYDLALECVELAETALAHDGVPPHGWTEKLAIVARKMGRVDLEVQALERWVSVCDANRSQSVSTPLHARLEKARALLASPPRTSPSGRRECRSRPSLASESARTRHASRVSPGRPADARRTPSSWAAVRTRT